MNISQSVSEASIPIDRFFTSSSIQSSHHIRLAIFKIEDQDGIIVAIAPDSTKLSIYQDVIDNRANLKTILDNGAIMIYFRDILVEEMKLKVIKISPRIILIMSHEKVSINEVVIFDMKFNGLPSE